MSVRQTTTRSQTPVALRRVSAGSALLPVEPANPEELTTPTRKRSTAQAGSEDPDEGEITDVEEVFFDADGGEMPGSNKKKRHASNQGNASKDTDAPVGAAVGGGVDPALLALLTSIKEDINATTTAAVDRIDKRIDDNAKAIRQVGLDTAADIDKLRQHVQDSETRVQRELEERDTRLERRLAAFEARKTEMTPGKLVVSTPRREEAYNKSRRSLKVWPVSGQDLTDAVKVFMASRLKIPDERICSLGPMSVRPSFGRAAVDRSEVLVVFDSREDRDFVKSTGFNLAAETNVGMAIHLPGHLLDNYHALSKMGYSIKKKHEGVKRAIKFDDSVQDVFLDICIAGSWRRILPKEAKEALRALPNLGGDDERRIQVGELVSLAGGEKPAVVVVDDGEEDME